MRIDFAALSLALACAAASAASATASDGKVAKADVLPVRGSSVGEGNLLPQFLFQEGAEEGGSTTVNIGGGRGTPEPSVPDDTCPSSIFEGASNDLRSPQLPYLTQDRWGCEREEGVEIPSLVVENERLKATITPSAAGKVWSLYDKKLGRDWFFANPAHQPANIGALKAWASGGLEFNWSPGIIGHSAFTESPAWVAEVDTTTSDGAEVTIVRVYEYDRYNSTVWQVDLLLTDDTLWMHPKITNNNPIDLEGYWWTCVAVPASPSTRILSPAGWVAETSGGPIAYSDWPRFAAGLKNSSFSGFPSGNMQNDNSFLGNIQSGDFFLQNVSSPVAGAYIAYTDAEDPQGFTAIHGHTLDENGPLKKSGGTKFFTWGQHGPGRFMQDFLAGDTPRADPDTRVGDYCELQVGPAPTQMQNFPLGASSTIEWTEWFKAFDDTTGDLLNDDYDIALGAIDKWLAGPDGMKKSEVDAMDEWFQEAADRPVDRILSKGMPWGGLEEARRGEQLAPGASFSTTTDDELQSAEVAPWLELLNDGTFSEKSLAALAPLSFQTTDAWMDKLSSTATSSMTWLHHLHLGVGLAERGEIEAPSKHFNASLELNPKNPIAARCLALLQTDTSAAYALYETAWSMAVDSDEDAFGSRERLLQDLATEISYFLQTLNDMSRLETFLASVESTAASLPCEPLLHLDSTLTSQAKLALAKGDPATVIAIIGADGPDGCFPTFASERTQLMDLWRDAQAMAAEQAAGTELNALQLKEIREQNKVPANIGCQYTGTWCTNVEDYGATAPF